MAMDKTTTRRMIGAIVLVLVAALVLAYLLKTKNNQPNVAKMQDVTLPSSPILAFPNDGSTAADGGGTANDSATGGEGTGSDSKVGLDIRPANGLTPADDASTAVGNAATQAQQGANNVADAGASTGSNSAQQSSGGKTGTADQNQGTANTPKQDAKNDIKKADVVSLGNDKVNSSRHNSNDSKDKDKSKENKHKKAPKPKLVGEKRLPKHSDKPKKKSSDKKKTASKKSNSNKHASAGSQSSSIPTDGFSIQLLATGSESKANAVKDEMISEGYPAYTMSVIQNGKTLYRVRIGSYQDKADADEIQAKMKRRYLQNSNVQNSLVVTN